MKKEFSFCLGGVVGKISVIVFVDVGVVEEGFVVFNARKGVSNLPLAGAERLDFGAFEHDARLQGFEDLVVVTGFAVAENVGLCPPGCRWFFHRIFGPIFPPGEMDDACPGATPHEAGAGKTD